MTDDEYDEMAAERMGLTMEELHEADRIYNEGMANLVGERGAVIHMELSFIDGEAVCTGMSIHPIPGIFLTKAEVEMVGHFVGLSD